MPPFEGFPPGKLRFTPIPGPFFVELLPQIDSLEEFKVTLYAFWRLNRMEGAFRYLRREDFSEDEKFMQGLGKNAQEALGTGLEKSVSRGTLLQAELELDGAARHFYFLNTARGRAAVQAVQRGEWRPSGDPQMPIELNLERPNVFRLYEKNIGPLTPMIADALKEAEESYPPAWIEEAVRLAVENNVRKWSYVEAILRRWSEEGRDAGKHRGDTEKDRKRYVEGEFSDFIEH